MIEWPAGWRERLAALHAGLSARRAGSWVLGLGSAGLALRFLLLIHRYAVNVLYRDSWDFFDPLFSEQNPWVLFRWQHGPHRQGLGMLFTAALAAVSSWNTRVEAFAAGVMLCMVVGLLLLVKRRSVGPLGWTDLAIPLAILTPTQHELFSGTVNLSHSVVPLLLLATYALALLVAASARRHALLVVLNVLAIHTGFGLFLGFITPFVLANDLRLALGRGERRDAGSATLALLMALASIALFFTDYQFMPAVDDFQFPHPQAWAYPQMMMLALTRFAGIPGLGLGPRLAGALLLALCIVVMLAHMRRLLDPRRQASRLDQVIVLCIGFSLLFSAGMAVGRISRGLVAAQDSRYMTLMAPAFVGLYLSACASGHRRKLLVALLVAGLAYAGGPLHSREAHELRWYRQGKTRWLHSYFATGSVEQADHESHFLIHPEPERARLDDKLAYLQARRLNLFLP